MGRRAKTANDAVLFTVPELAEFLRCSPETVYRMLHRRELPGFKIGNHDWRFQYTDIKRWIDMREREFLNGNKAQAVRRDP